MKITWINTHTIWLQMKPSHRSFNAHNTRSSQIEKRRGRGMHVDNEPFSIEENNRWMEVTLCTTIPPDIYTSMDMKAMMFFFFFFFFSSCFWTARLFLVSVEAFIDVYLFLSLSLSLFVNVCVYIQIKSEKTRQEKEEGEIIIECKQIDESTSIGFRYKPCLSLCRLIWQDALAMTFLSFFFLFFCSLSSSSSSSSTSSAMTTTNTDKIQWNISNWMDTITWSVKFIIRFDQKAKRKEGKGERGEKKWVEL